MTIHTFHDELWLPAPRTEVFAFFADAQNLEKITPTWLNFSILTPAPITMQAGARIDYRLRIHGIPVRWKTEITTWEPPHRFVDSQLSGPYRQWIHTHTFEEKDGGTLCRDRVEYAVPGGALVHRLFVQKDVQTIFAFRATALRQLFPSRG